MRVPDPVIRALSRSLEKFAGALPWGGKQALLRGLHTTGSDEQYRMLSDLAQRLRVETFIVPGEYGRIQSSSRDFNVLLTYARSGRFAARTNELLRRFFSSSEPAHYVDIGANIGL